MINNISNPNEFAEEVQTMMKNAAPRKKAAFKDKGIIFTPRKKEKYRVNKSISGRMKSISERYKGEKKRESRNFRRSLTKALVGKSYNDHKLRSSLNIKWDYWSTVSVVTGEEVRRSDAMSDEKIEHVKKFYLDESQVMPDKHHASLKTRLSKRQLGQTLQQKIIQDKYFTQHKKFH